jgi:RNA polymerase sigma factor (sigma-70 family)
MADQTSAAMPEQGAGLLSAFLSYRALLVRSLRRIVKRHEIDDILQETFIRSYEASRKNTINHPRAFLLRTATNLALNHVGRADNRCLQQPESEQHGDESLGEAPIERAVESSQRFRVLCRAVRRLPEQCRHVFILRMVYGLSQREIAQRTQLSESTVEKHIAKGLVMCREHMEAAGYSIDAAAIDGRRAGVRRS